MMAIEKRKWAARCESILMADTCIQPSPKDGAFQSIWQSFRRHVVRHAFPEGKVPSEVLQFVHSMVRFRLRIRFWPQRPAEAQVAQPAPAGLPPDRAAQPDRGRTSPQVIAPAITVLSSSVQDGGAFSGAAIGGQRAAGFSRRGGGPGAGRSRRDTTGLTP
jgi:hypothetical protein